MKRKLLLIIPIFALFVITNVSAQDILAEDYASNYSETEFENLENLGTGFGDWYRVVDGEDAAVLLQSAADNGTNAAVIDTDDQSFTLRASLSDNTDQRVDLGREFLQPLADGETLSFDLAWNWASPGLTGIVLYNGSWDVEDQTMLLDFDSGGYFVNGEMAEEHASEEDWEGWREDGVALEVIITRSGDNLEYSVIATTDESHVDFSGVVEGVNADRIKFFNDGRPNWGEENPGQGSLFFNSLVITEGVVTSAEEDVMVNDFTLEQNYPNPFNPITTINFSLESASQVQLSVYDMLGREVHILEEGFRSAGSHTVQFDASALPSGVYIYRLSADGHAMTKRMTLMK